MNIVKLSSKAGEDKVMSSHSVVHGWITCSKVVTLMKVGYQASGSKNLFRLLQVVHVFVLKFGTHLNAQSSVIY